MMRLRNIAAAVVIFTLALPAAAFARNAAVKASSLVGMEVRSTASAGAGRIRDLAIDIGNNRVHYAELDLPGRMLAAPPDHLAISPAGTHAVFTPGDRSIDTRAGMELARASALIGWKVTNEAGEPVGSLLDLAIDPTSGRVPFAVLRLERPAGDGALHPVPLDAFAIYSGRDSLVLTVDRDRLQPSSGFTLEQLEAGLADADFVRQHADYADRLTPEASGAGATQPEDRGALFNRMDRDGDGTLSEAELDGPIAGRRNWMAIDLDRDGRISRAEFTAVRR